MEMMDASKPAVGIMRPVNPDVIATEAEDFGHLVDEMFIKVDKLEQTLNDIEQFYSVPSRKQSNTSKGNLIPKDKDKDKHLASYRKRQQDASRRESAAVKRMQELMRQFGTILRQVIDNPMDFSTIKNKMEAKDGSGYKSVREMCTDVRLIFKNAMKYNDERDDVHVMAKTLLAKFEEKWLQLLPKVDEEKSRKEEEAEAQLDMQLAQEATHAKMARDLSIEFDEVDRHLEELREMVLQKCRRMSTDEKKKLQEALTSLSPEDIDKALQIVAQNNPGFQATTYEVDLDMDSQSESTLWKLKFLVKDALQLQGKSSASMGGNNHQNNNNKRKKEICDALAKTSHKRSKKLTT